MQQITWKGAVALITGGGSGIGRALSLAMAKLGVTMVVTDINLEKASQTATECGGGAVAYKLDVRDAMAFEQTVDAVYTRFGKIDLLFNNAGIGVAGETHEIAAQLWDRIIDINIKGVLNGVLAVYPRMIQQASGCIVNVASLAGLNPVPLMSPYAMTKHAVVGLSNSLRIEAADFGVQVNTLCPAAIQTPILSKANPHDLPPVNWAPNTVRYLSNMAGEPYPVDLFADEALQAIERNEGLIVLPERAKQAYLAGKLAPERAEQAILRAVQYERSFKK